MRPYNFVIREQRSRPRVRIGSSVNDGPTSTQQHEDWHTDGALKKYNDIANQQGLPKREGYRSGAIAAKAKIIGDLRRFVRDHNGFPSANELRTKLAELYELYTVTKVNVIIAHGAWHVESDGPFGGLMYSWNEANDMNF
jgi:hypothetical protein